MAIVLKIIFAFLWIVYYNVNVVNNISHTRGERNDPMNSNDNQPRKSVFPSLLCQYVLFFLTRAVAITPLFFPNFFTFFGNGELIVLLTQLGAVALLFFFLVWPERIFTRVCMLKVQGCDGHVTYLDTLKIALLRIVKASIAWLPLLVVIGFFYYCFIYDTFKSIAIISKIGKFFDSTSMGFDIGLIVMFVALAFFLLFFALVWYIGSPNDYSIAKSRVKKGFLFFFLGLFNALLCLFPIIPLFFIFPFGELVNIYFASSSLMEMAPAMLEALSLFAITNEKVIWLLLDLCFLYVPTLFLRKFQMAKYCATHSKAMM